MKSANKPVTVKEILLTHAERQDEIRERLLEFQRIWQTGSDLQLWEEMVFCFFTGGCSAKMGLRSVEAVRAYLVDGGQERLAAALTGVHRFPNARARYIVYSRNYLNEVCGMRIRDELESRDHLERRDWLARDKGIKGLAYKEASHFLRNIGLRGYAILDKHVLNCLAELKVISDPRPPKSRDEYLNVEKELIRFADRLKIDFDEMDLLLWSMKTGEILK